MNLSLHNKQTFVYCAFLNNLPQLSPQPSPHSPTSSVFSWRWYLRLWFGPLWKVTQFPWLALMYAGDIHVIKLVSLLLLCLFMIGRSQPRTQKDRGKIFFFPML